MKPGRQDVKHNVPTTSRWAGKPGPRNGPCARERQAIRTGFAHPPERHARSAIPHRRIRVIAMTAHIMPGDRKKCLEAGMDDYVSMPVEPSALAEVLEKWLLRGPGVEWWRGAWAGAYFSSRTPGRAEPSAIRHRGDEHRGDHRIPLRIGHVGKGPPRSRLQVFPDGR
jgi:hypothetical protein